MQNNNQIIIYIIHQILLIRKYLLLLNSTYKFANLIIKIISSNY